MQIFLSPLRLCVISLFATLLGVIFFLPSIPHGHQPRANATIGVYCINLDRAPHRWHTVSPLLQQLGLPLHRFPAIDGRNLSLQCIDQHVNATQFLHNMGVTVDRGSIGCYMSHIGVWESFLRSSYTYALVMEDDILFDPFQLLSIVENLKKRPGWDIVQLEPFHRGMPLPLTRLTDEHTMVLYATRVAHTGAYLIHRKAVPVLLKEAFPMQMPIDHYFTRSWEHGSLFVGVSPRPVSQKEGPSDIAVERERQRKVPSFARVWFQVRSEVLRFLYNLKAYVVLLYRFFWW